MAVMSMTSSTLTNGDFRTHFKFHMTPDHKIKRLDIGQD